MNFKGLAWWMGPAIGGFTPKNLPGLDLWLLADDIIGNDGDVVAAWNDRSGNGRNFTQATGGKQPLLKKAANGINGHNTVLFNGTSDLLVASNFASNVAGTVFAVVRLSASPSNFQTVIGSADEAGTTGYWVCRAFHTAALPKIGTKQRSGLVGTEDEMRGSTSLVAGNNYLMMWQSSGTAYSFRLNKAAETITVVAGANNGDWIGDVPDRDNFTLGAVKLSVETNFLKAAIPELIMCNTALSTTQIAQVEAYLANRYGPFDIVVGFGDSVTAGSVASDADHRWLNIIAAAKNWQLINSGDGGTVLENTVQNSVAVIGGAASANGRDTYTARVTAYAPNYVLVLYGLNDLRLNDAAFTVAEFQNDLGEVVDGIITAGISASSIVLGSPPHMTNYAGYAPWNGGSAVKHDLYRDAVASVAAARGTKYIDVYQWMLDNGGDTLVSVDGVHPNDSGHAAIANAFLSVL